MPDLPAISVTTEQGTRIMAAFGGHTDADGNPITPEQAYRRWLRRQLRLYVVAQETKALDMKHNDARAKAIADAETALP